MVDTVKILGALLGGGGMSSGSGANILKSVLGAAMKGKQGAGLEDLLGSVLGGAQKQSGGGLSGGLGGGLGDVLGSVLGGGSQQGSQGGGLGDLLGGMLGGNQNQAHSQANSPAGNLGDVLGGLLGGGGGPKNGGGSDLGDLIGAALNQFGHSEQASQNNLMPRNFEEHSPNMVHAEANDQATLLIRGMINAAKADGKLDKQEHAKITGQLGNVTQDEIDFINDEISKPLDVEEFARSVPPALANQVYAMSLTAIDLDTNPEAQYLHQLAQGLNINSDTANQIHQQLGAPLLYS